MPGEGARFASEVRAWVERAKAKPERVIGQFLVNLSTELLIRTPVGDPSLWKRKTPPPGYIGGALRANWNFSVGLIDETNGKPPNSSVPEGINRLRKAIAPGIADKDVYIVNAQPYARRIEYEGHSSQAPQGMVRLTAVQAQEFMNQAIQQVTE